MPATLENIKGRDLPPAWKRKARVSDDQIVSVTITPQTRKTPVRQQKPRFDMAEVEKILARVDALPILDNRTSQEISDDLYDEFGLPK